MATVTYAVVFSGQVVEGFQVISVKAHMAKTLKADLEKMAMLFSGKPVVLKRTANKEEAIKYGTALKKIGADVKVKAIKSEAPAQAAEPTTGAQAPAAGDASGLSLAPNEGYLVEPTPPAPAPQIDLSGLELAADDGSPLIAPKPLQVVELDLSEYPLSEPDGSPLVEPSVDIALKIEVPDFSLDEPGAVLETIKEREAEIVIPDVSGLSIAEPGADLLAPEEKPRVSPPRVPDISNIHLVPNFDT